MAAPRGPYTPRSGPLAGQTFYGRTAAATAGYQEYQAARAQALYGFRTYGQERAAAETSSHEAMFRVVAGTMRANGASSQDIRRAYLELRQQNNGKHPTRNQVRETLRQRGYINENEEPDWGQIS